MSFAMALSAALTQHENMRSLMCSFNLSFLCHSTMPARIDVPAFALSWKEMVH